MRLEDIQDFNRHWETNKISFARPEKSRKHLRYLIKYLKEREMILISGLRRVGKSVLQQELIHEFLKIYPNLNKKNILYFSFDSEDDLSLLDSKEFEELMRIYLDKILDTHPQDVDQPVLMAIDEIQNVKSWQKTAKKYYDLNPNFKFLLTGSSSLFLSDSSDSLAGRTFELDIPCIDFSEFCYFINSDIKFQKISEIKELKNFSPIKVTSKYIELFEVFLTIGGFPQTIEQWKKGFSISEVQKFIRKSIIDKVITRDLRKYFKLEKTQEDKRLFEVCSRESSFFLVISNIATEVGLSEPAIKEHLKAFEASSLISFLSKFDKSLRREIKSTRKVYVASPCIMYANSYLDHTNDPSFLGQAVETYAYSKLKTYKEKLYVYKGRQDKEEIDFFLKNENFLIESKYSNRARFSDFKFLLERRTALNSECLVLSKKDWQFGQLNCLPVMFL